MAVGTLKKSVPTGLRDILTLEDIKLRLFPIFEKYHVRQAFLFGSYARGEATPESDVDIRIDCADNPLLKTLFRITGFRQQLDAALGKEVDLLTMLPSKKYDPVFHQNVLRDEVLLYGTPAERHPSAPAYPPLHL